MRNIHSTTKHNIWPVTRKYANLQLIRAKNYVLLGCYWSWTRCEKHLNREVILIHENATLRQNNILNDGTPREERVTRRLTKDDKNYKYLKMQLALCSQQSGCLKVISPSSLGAT